MDFLAGAAPLNALQPMLIQMTWIARLVVGVSELTVAAGGGCSVTLGGRQSRAGAAVSQLPGCTGGTVPWERPLLQKQGGRKFREWPGIWQNGNLGSYLKNKEEEPRQRKQL